MTKVNVSAEIVSPTHLIRTEYYNDFLRPQNWFHSTGVLTAENSFLVILRPERDGSFDEEVELFQHIAPHITRAAGFKRRLNDRIAGLESGLNAAAATLDRFRTGVMVVDSNAKLILLNRAGEAILQRRDGLILSRDGLRAASCQENTKLQNAIGAVSFQRGPGLQKQGTVLTISRPSGSKSFEVLVAPVTPHRRLARGGPAAALFITDPEDRAEVDGQTMRQLFGLTLAETRLAIALVNGKRVEEYAQEASISSNTALTHLKRIYSKTEVRRQSELVRLLLNSSARI